MADPTPIEQPDPGAPIARDHIDPDLVKLSRPRPKVGIITAAGLVLLCALFLVRLGPDRRFAGESPAPTPATVADIVSGKLETDKLLVVHAEPLISQAIRTTNAKGSLGLRVVPVRGTADRLWLAVSGDGWDPASVDGYTGRLRRLDDVAFADATRSYAAGHPRLAFATAAAVRAAAAGKLTTVTGDQVSVSDGDVVAADLALPTEATVVATFNDNLPDVAAWRTALDQAGLAPTSTGPTDTALGQVRFTVAASVEVATTRLEAAKRWAARVEPITRHYETTWGALRKSSPAGLDLGGAAVPDAQVDLVGIHAVQRIPSGAYVLVTGEQPDDYWYVLPITIALAAILLVFAWALFRAIRRDLVPPRAA